MISGFIRPLSGRIAHEVDSVVDTPVVDFRFKDVGHDCVVVACATFVCVRQKVANVHEIRIAQTEPKVDNRSGRQKHLDGLQCRVPFSLRK